MDTPELPVNEALPGRSGETIPDSIADVLHDIAAAVRELADRSEPDPLQLLHAEDVAALLRLPVRTVRERAAAGAIPHRRFGKHYRFSRADVEAIVRQMERAARPDRRGFRAA